jgi:pimeloyl-ACP methyl ester carboxylesterase
MTEEHRCDWLYLKVAGELPHPSAPLRAGRLLKSGKHGAPSGGVGPGGVSGRALDCGHLLPEEKPEEVLAELKTFFAH